MRVTVVLIADLLLLALASLLLLFRLMRKRLAWPKGLGLRGPELLRFHAVLRFPLLANGLAHPAKAHFQLLSPLPPC